MKRYIPLIIILVFMIIALSTGVANSLSFEALKSSHQQLSNFVKGHAIAAPLIFILVYLTSTALSLPGGLFLSVLGGFLFPIPWSTLYVVIGATIGASILFLSAKTALGEFLKRKAGPLLQKMEAGFSKNAVSYLLFLRFVPLFPFWLVNLAPAFFNVRLRTFVWTTFLGIIPGAFVFTQAGSGLGAILESNETFSLASVFNLKMKIALIALGLFSLIPIMIKRMKKSKDA